MPRDNDWTYRLLVPRYVLIPQVLRGLGIADDGPLTLGLTTPQGNSRTVDIEPIPMSDYNDWAGPYGLHLPANADVAYLSRIGDALWWLGEVELAIRFRERAYAAFRRRPDPALAAVVPLTIATVRGMAALRAAHAARGMELVANLPKPEGFFDPKAPAGEVIPPERDRREAVDDPEVAWLNNSTSRRGRRLRRMRPNGYGLEHVPRVA